MWKSQDPVATTQSQFNLRRHCQGHVGRRLLTNARPQSGMQGFLSTNHLERPAMVPTVPITALKLGVLLSVEFCVVSLQHASTRDS